MLSRNISHILLTFLLLFGQFSTLAHALEHLSYTENAESCQLGKINHDTHQVPGHDPNNAGHGAHVHHGQNAKTLKSSADCTQNTEISETETCLIYHLHGNIQSGIDAKLVYTDFYSHPCGFSIRKTDAVIPVFIALYDSRGPPADRSIA